MLHPDFYNLVARRLSGEIQAADEVRLRELLQDESHQEAYQDAVKSWELLGKHRPVHSFDADAAWNDFQTRVASRPSKKQGFAILKIAAAIILMASLITVFLYVMPDNSAPSVAIKHEAPVTPPPVNQAPVMVDSVSMPQPAPAPVHHRSPKREKITTITVASGDSAKLCILPDNSVVYLNVNSILEYPSKFINHERAVVLRGEAYFDVVPSGDPFRVHCQETISTAVGTSFNVKGYENTSQVEMMVMTGKVEFSYKGRAVLEKQVLAKGEGIRFDASKEQMSKISIRKKDRWWERGGLRKRLSDFFSRLVGKNKHK